MCDFPVVRKGKHGTCDAKLCDKCRVAQPEADTDFCPPHARLKRRAEEEDVARWDAASEKPRADNILEGK